MYIEEIIVAGMIFTGMMWVKEELHSVYVKVNSIIKTKRDKR